MKEEPLSSESPFAIPFQPRVGNARVRISRLLVDQIQADLRRPHPFAFERIGFVSVAMGRAGESEVLVIAEEYFPVADDQYVRGNGVGARIGSDAIRDVMQRVHDTGRGFLHVHLHDHHGRPDFSPVDRSEQPRLVASLRVMNRTVPHGMLVLSADEAEAWLWLPNEDGPVSPRAITLVGYPTIVLSAASDSVTVVGTRDAHPPNAGKRFVRQSFLGSTSQAKIERIAVAVVGLGGGGSHVVQQLAHVGFRHYRLFDGDAVDESNLNRLVGATADDARLNTPKTQVAERVIRALNPTADMKVFTQRWQQVPEMLRGADIVIGCVDTFAERQEIEVACRRYCIPYIDIGMDVNVVKGEPPRMAGQVILSLPGDKCLFCVGFLTERRLAEEAAEYGGAGARPQVVWPNGVLASTAVGVLMDLVTGWTRRRSGLVYLSYDGNVGTLVPHVRLRFLDESSCEHYNVADVGDPVLYALD